MFVKIVWIGLRLERPHGVDFWDDQDRVVSATRVVFGGASTIFIVMFSSFCFLTSHFNIFLPCLPFARTHSFNQRPPCSLNQVHLHPYPGWGARFMFRRSRQILGMFRHFCPNKRVLDFVWTSSGLFRLSRPKLNSMCFDFLDCYDRSFFKFYLFDPA